MFTVADVARLSDLDYGVVHKIDHEVLRRLIQLVQIPDPINISVDEKSFKKVIATLLSSQIVIQKR